MSTALQAKMIIRGRGGQMIERGDGLRSREPGQSMPHCPLDWFLWSVPCDKHRVLTNFYCRLGLVWGKGTGQQGGRSCSCSLGVATLLDATMSRELYTWAAS